MLNRGISPKDTPFLSSKEGKDGVGSDNQPQKVTTGSNLKLVRCVVVFW